MTVADKQEFSFQTEIKQLLNILSHSLYQNKEIALRELVSNASDSLNKMRHIQLTSDQHRDDQPLEITIEPDKTARTLTIRDNGIGLTRDELVANLGTIAHSGSLEFLNHLSGDAKSDLSLIGQFGVGFYAAFMLADKVQVITRSYQEPEAEGTTGWRWESEGTGQYTIEPADVPGRGAQVVLFLKEGLDDFLDPYRLKTIIRKYSTFVPHPVKLEGEQLNSQRPIWVEPKSQLTDDDYGGFYQYLTHRTDEKPLWHLHLTSDSPLQFQAILYCPPTNFELMGFGQIEHGVNLCAKRILVQDNCSELLPEYLRFVYGLVDSADLPLNVSRETLQDSTILRKIGKVLTKRVLDYLATLADEQPEKYREFYQQFGSIVRSGITTDYENRERIGKLLRFPSTTTEPEQTTSLDAYISRVQEDQKQIYLLGGPDLPTIRKSPNLEIFRKRNLEVLFVADPVDEVMLTNLREYSGKTLVSIDSSDIEFPESSNAAAEAADAEAKKEDAPASEAGLTRVMELFRQALGDKVQEVRESKRLTDSPCCLVNPKGAMSTQMQKMLKMTSKGFEMSNRILEVNPQSALVRRLAGLSSNSQHDAFIEECGRQLFANALLLEGMLPEPEDAVNRVQRFMEELSEKRSPIVL